MQKITAFSGSSFTFKVAFQGMVIGAAFGGIIGGIDGGLRAIDNNGEFWSGEKWQEIKIGGGQPNPSNSNIGDFSSTQVVS